MTPLDFFFWGFVKACVFLTPVTDIDELKRRIILVMTLFNTNILAKTWVELRRRLDFLHEIEGQQYELSK